MRQPLTGTSQGHLGLQHIEYKDDLGLEVLSSDQDITFPHCRTSRSLHHPDLIRV
jgi:hypothetical protein